MKILHLTDIHSKKSIIEKISKELESAELILISGDITHFGREKETENIINEIKKYNKSVYAVAGNCDYPEVSKYLEGHHVSLDRKIINIDNIAIFGIGGSLPCPGATPNEFSEGIFDLELSRLYKNLQGDSKQLILLIHQPPYNTKNDRVNSGLHVGSKAVRKFIEDKQPALVLCGHIHEAKAVDTIGETKIVNPGSFRDGFYAIIEIQEKDIVVSLKNV